MLDSIPTQTASYSKKQFPKAMYAVGEEATIDGGARCQIMLNLVTEG